MEPSQAIKLAKKLKISPVEIVREKIEIYILDNLSKSFLSNQIVFKGGTALRLVYHSPYFSQDLDFSVIKKVNLLILKNF